jgi:hypothetical protein
VFIELNQERTQRAGALGASLAISVKRLSRAAREGCRRRLAWSAQSAIRALPQCHQHLPRILEITSPQQGGTLAGQSVRGISREAIVTLQDTSRGRRVAWRVPACAT